MLHHLELFAWNREARSWVAQPLHEILDQLERRPISPTEACPERIVERVEVRLRVHAESARHLVETVEGAVVQAEGERPCERRRFLQPYLDLAVSEFKEQRQKDHAGPRSVEAEVAPLSLPR